MAKFHSELECSARKCSKDADMWLVRYKSGGEPERERLCHRHARQKVHQPDVVSIQSVKAGS